MNDRQETQLYKLLYPVMAELLRKYRNQAMIEAYIVEQDLGNPKKSFENEADALITDVVVSMFTGTFQTEARSRKIWFILDFCYSIAKRAIYQVIKGKVDDFTIVELIWLVWAQVDTRVVLRNREEQWRQFQNRLLVDNLDED